MDEQLRYRLCMPEGWRDLGFDRSAWIEAFGDEVTQLEIAVRSGNLDHVAVPLSPAGNDDFASLVIDSPELDASDTLEERRGAFLDANVELDADLLSSEIVDLDGVRAARAALDVSNVEGSTRDGLLILYLVPMSSDRAEGLRRDYHEYERQGGHREGRNRLNDRRVRGCSPSERRIEVDVVGALGWSGAASSRRGCRRR